MKFGKLFKEIAEIPKKYQEKKVLGICDDSRKLKKGEIFIAMKGNTTDGHFFVSHAVKKGASCIIISKKFFPQIKTEVEKLKQNILLLPVESPKKVLIELCSRLYGCLSDKMKLIAITGTNGKTTSSYIINSILEKCGYTTSLFGTINYKIGKKFFESTNTTPGVLKLHYLLYNSLLQKIEYCIMEVSSHALDQNRLGNVKFDIVCFTNLSLEHLDYHHNFYNYAKAKLKLLTLLKPKGKVIINIDDNYFKNFLLSKLRKSDKKYFSYGIQNKADVNCKNLKLGLEGSKFQLISPLGSKIINTHLIGIHNIYNILAASSVCLALGINNLDFIKSGIEDLKTIPGRLEPVNCGQKFKCLIDYAHTPDALEKVLTSLRPLTSGRILLVFGCGGDRDRTKRPKMGEIASQLSDFCILTSDNPRSESTLNIIKEVEEGMRGYNNFEVIFDRYQAIKRALSLAKAGDIVIIAGKGHENFQIFKNKRVHFDDREVARKLLLDYKAQITTK